MDAEDVRLAVYDGFARTGRAPGLGELSVRFGASEADVRAALRRLACARHVVLGADEAVLLAHPFASVPLGFAAMGPRTLWWGGCAWEAFSLPHLVPDAPEVLVSTRCPGCGAALAWVVRREGPPAGAHVAHFLVPVERMWHDVVRTCEHQRLFCERTCVRAWLTRSGYDEGYVMDLVTLWRLARHWYEGRLERGYVRREPAQAAAYFREVGLQGAFWGL